MIIKEITNCIEEIAPLQYAEDFDNVGLLVGNYETEVINVLVTLDTLEKTVDEAIEKNCNLIISFHPIIFGGLKKLNGNNYVERVVLKAIKNNIAIYATHTALDNSNVGVSAKIAEVLGLENTKVLIPKKGILQQLTTYVPKKDAKSLQQALFTANAGSVGNYEQCSFTVEGKGTFKANENANPTLGEKGKLHTENEVKKQKSPLNSLAEEIMPLEDKDPSKIEKFSTKNYPEGTVIQVKIFLGEFEAPQFFAVYVSEVWITKIERKAEKKYEIQRKNNLRENHSSNLYKS